MNEIVLLRHGRALSTREAGVHTDAERPLSSLGEKEVLETAAHLKRTGFSPALIIHSPYLRAARTAELAATVFSGASLRAAAELSDGPSTAALDILIDAASQPGAAVLAVGHQPMLGAIAGVLSGCPPLDLAPAGFARIKPGQKAGQGALAEFYDPQEPKEAR